MTSSAGRRRPPPALAGWESPEMCSGHALPIACRDPRLKPTLNGYIFRGTIDDEVTVEVWGNFVIGSPIRGERGSVAPAWQELTVRRWAMGHSWRSFSNLAAVILVAVALVSAA